MKVRAPHEKIRKTGGYIIMAVSTKNQNMSHSKFSS